MFKEKNEPPSLTVQSFLKSKLGKNCVELWPAVIVIKKKHLYIFPDEINIFLSEYALK